MQGHYIRIAGSTKNPKGESIVGTYMDKKVADIIDAEGRYVGEANVAGGMIYCIYEALYNEKGEIVGCIVVGRNVSELNKTINSYVLRLMLPIGLFILVVGYLMVKLLNKTVKDIDIIVARLNHLNENEDIEDDIVVSKNSFLEPIAYNLNKLHEVQKELDKKRIEVETDELTKLPNRFGIDSFLKNNYHQIIKNKEYFGIEIIDVDFFKEYNDNYGHPEGDKCLKTVADILKKYCSSDIIAARLGGDEFIMLFRNVKSEEIKRIQNLIKEDIYKANLSHKFSKISDRVSISQGAYNSVPIEGTTYLDLYKQADKVLYNVKEHGKNNYGLSSK